MQANWACATAKQSGPAHVHCHRPELRCAPASEEELPAEETAVHPASDTCKLVQTADACSAAQRRLMVWPM